MAMHPSATGSLRRLAAGAWRGVIDALLPPHCLTCDASVGEQGTQCPACWQELVFAGHPLCDGCGVPLGHEGLAERQGPALVCPYCEARPRAFARARAVYWYGPGSKKLVLPLKYNDRTELARWLARRMAAAQPEMLAGCDIILPVPLHRSRLLARRYNQAALLARQLARLSGRPWAPDWLLRPHATPPLQERGAAERAALVSGAFAVARRARVAGKRVLLVDDVLTSGATVEECAALLLRAGAAQVEVLVVARAVDKRLLG